MEVWDKLKTPDQVSSRRKWTIKEDSILFNELRAYLKKNKQSSFSAEDRKEVFAEILADHGSQGTKTRVFAGRSAQALRVRASTRVRNAMEKRQPVPEDLQALFRWRKVPVSSSVRSREPTPGPNQGASLPRRRSFIVVQDDSSDESEGEEGSTTAGEENSEDELDLSGSTRSSTSATNLLSSHQQDTHRQQEQRGRDALSSPGSPDLAPSLSAPFSAEENAKQTKLRLAALNPFTHASVGGDRDNSREAAMVQRPDAPERPSPPIKLEQFQEQTVDAQDSAKGEGSEVDELETPGNHVAGGILASEAEPAIKFKFTAIMSENWEPVRSGVKNIIESSAIKVADSRNLRLEDLPFTETARGIIDLMRHFGPQYRMEWPPDCPNAKQIWNNCCSAIAASVAFAVFESVVPAHWSVRRVCFAVAGYLSTLVQLPEMPEAFRPHFKSSAIRGLWSLRAAKKGSGHLETEAEDLTAALMVVLGSIPSRQEVLHTEMTNPHPEILQTSVRAIKRYLGKLEASIRFTARCPVAASWGSLKQVPSTAIPMAKSRRMLQLWLQSHPDAPSAIREDYKVSSVVRGAMIVECTKEPTGRLIDPSIHISSAIPQEIEAILARWAKSGLM